METQINTVVFKLPWSTDCTSWNYYFRKKATFFLDIMSKIKRGRIAVWDLFVKKIVGGGGTGDKKCNCDAVLKFCGIEYKKSYLSS